jgi:ATP-dependent helicase/nuclease subunit B
MAHHAKIRASAAVLFKPRRPQDDCHTPSISSEPMKAIQLVAHGPPAREALRDAVRSAKGSDPLAPVTVVAPSTYAGLALRRALAGPHGLVNVRFLVLPRLAELLGAPALAERRRRPLTRPLRAEAVRAVLTDAGAAFGAVAAHPATERALDASFLDLRRAGDVALEQIAHAGEPAASVARLYREFRSRTAAFYDDEDLAVAAADAIESSPPALRELGDVILFLPTRLSPAEAQLIRALARAGRLRVLLGLTGDANADEPIDELTARLAGVGPAERAPGGAAPTGTSIVSAPDPEDEVRAVVRTVLTLAAAGTPLHRVAIVFRLDDPYARLAHELLDAAGIPWSGPSMRRLADTTAGRILLGLLRLAERDFARDAVVEWIASGPVRDPVDDRAVPASRWDTVSREAGIVTGLVQWNDRLTRYARWLRADLEARGDDELSEGARLHRAADLAHAEHLARFVADLGARLTPPSPGTWPRLAAWARDLLDVYLGGEGRRATWPEPEVEAARRVTDALDGLAALAEIRAEASLSTFVRALESELDSPAGRVGRFGAGVFVGDIHHAYGGDFDVVHVVGMAEGAFPPLGREDPLIPDRLRRLTGGALPVHAVRRAEERRDYLAALAAAPARSLSYPRADPRAQRKRLPARWLLESASHLAGVTVGADELTRSSSAGWLQVVPSFEAGVRAPGEAGSLSERDVRSLRAWQEARRPIDRHPLVTATPSLAAGVTAVRDRRSATLTRFDGHVGAVPGLLPAEDDAVSPTALQDWATCPFRYLLGRVLRIREVERPEATDRISPLERGSLVHRVLAEFLDAVEPRTSPDQPWADDERALLLAIGERHCNEAEAEGLTGRPLLWKLDRRRILREIEGFVDTDEQIRATLGVVPRPGARELKFGFGGDSGEPAEVTLSDGRTVRFHGVIDRVDEGPGGSRVVVYDYKTGRVEDPAAGLERGNLLQLPVYALAMAGSDVATDVRAFYWSLRPGADALVGITLDDATHAKFVDKITTITDGIAAGVFPAFPDGPRQDGRGRDTWVNCCYCPFDRVCPTARDDDWTRKRVDPVVARFRELADPPEHGDDTDGVGVES